MQNLKIFISYSSKDVVVAESLQMALEATGFQVWRDKRSIEADWSREIAFALADAQAICLLWTAAAEQSEWVKHEWLTAQALEKRIFPCLFQQAPALPKPLHNLEAIAFESVEEGSGKLVDAISGAKSCTFKYDYTILPENSYLPFNPNPRFCGRQFDLLELYLNMIGDLNKCGVREVGVVAMGGTGKTQLVVEFAYRFSFAFHLIYWINSPDAERWAKDFVELAKHRFPLIRSGTDAPETDEQYIHALQKYFKEHPGTLIIMDNVEDPLRLNSETVFGVPITSLGCDLLFTTRRHFNLSDIGVLQQQLDYLSPEAAYELLNSYRTPRDAEEAHYSRDICKAFGFLPLAVVIAGGYLREYKDEAEVSFANYYNTLIKDRLQVLDDCDVPDMAIATRHMTSVKATLESHWVMLKDENSRYLFKLAGQFPESEIIPKARMGLLSGIRSGSSPLDQPLAKALNRLKNLCLIEILADAAMLRLHPLVREFSSLLVAEQERDAFRHVAATRLKDAYFDYQVLQKQINTRGSFEVIEDLKVACEWLRAKGDDIGDLEDLADALHLSSHILTQYPAQLTGHLMARMMSHPSPVIASLLEQAANAKSGCWLRPNSPTLTPPGGPLLLTMPACNEGITAVAISPDASFAVSARADGKIDVWDLHSGFLLKRLEGHAAWVSDVTVALDGCRVASVSKDGDIKIWNLKSGKEIITLKGDIDSVKAAALLPQERAVIFASHNTIEEWDLQAGRRLTPLECYSLYGAPAAVFSGGNRGVFDWEFKLMVCDLQSGETLRVLPYGGVHTLAVTPDGRTAVTISTDWSLRVLDLFSGEEAKMFYVGGSLYPDPEKHQQAIEVIAITPDGAYAITGSQDCTVRLWNLGQNRMVGDFVMGAQVAVLEHSGWIIDMAVSSDGKCLVTATNNGEFKVWDLSRCIKSPSLKKHTKRVCAVAVTPDGQRVVTGGSDRTVKIWDLATGEMLDSWDGNWSRKVTDHRVMPERSKRGPASAL